MPQPNSRRDGTEGREQEAIAIGHIFNWQGESALQNVLICDHQGKEFDFVFMISISFTGRHFIFCCYLLT
jgi:hypothetical protein